MKNKIQEAFKEKYGAGADAVFFAPARVNLIGEHIDYNGGWVLPCALEIGTCLALRKISEPVLKFYSVNFPEEALDIPLEKKKYQKQRNHWSNYPLGIIDYFIQAGKSLCGLEMLFWGNIPSGGGLSSSASIEVVTAYALNQLFGTEYTKEALARLAQKVENDFIGVRCGIMDQFSVAMGKKNHVLLLNCQTLALTYIPFHLKDYNLLIINTNKQRRLTDSKYNERRASCEAALQLLNERGYFKDLCSVAPAFFEKNKDCLNEEQQKRVQHVVYEQDRVVQAADALRNNRLETFGALMRASHQSLKDDYEVTGEELDAAYFESIGQAGVIGCRMTGGGFGGCAVAIVAKDKVAAYKERLIQRYTEKIGYAPSVFSVGIGAGVRAL